MSQSRTCARPLLNLVEFILEESKVPAFVNEFGVSERYLHKISRCVFLAPDIVEVILEGRQPAELTLDKLLDDLPIKI